MTMYIAVMRAIATGDPGAERMFFQLTETARNRLSLSSEGYRYLSWDFILQSFVGLCDILIRHSGQQVLGIGTEELSGFAAYLQLIGYISNGDFA